MDRGSSPLRLTRACYALSLVARPLIALAPSVFVVGLLRMADGLGKGGKDAPEAVLVAADADQQRMGRSFGIQTTLGSVVRPVVAGVILLIGGHGESGLRICLRPRLPRLRVRRQRVGAGRALPRLRIFYAAADGVIKAWITSLVPVERRGQAFGLNAAASGFLLLPASVIAGALWDTSGPRAAFLFGAVTPTLALAVLALAPSLRARTTAT